MKEKMRGTGTKRVSLTLTESLYERLKREADRMEISVNSLIRIACQEFVSRREIERSVSQASKE